MAVLIIVLLGLIPLFWFQPGFIISNGDSYPNYINFQKTLNTARYLWSPNPMGTADLTPAYIIYEYIAVSLHSFGLNVNAIQIVFQIFFLIGAGLSMLYLTKSLYPALQVAPLIASIFYMFNFFVMQSRLNLGLAWTYTFIPLLVALLINAVAAAYSQKNRHANRLIICLAITSMIAFSVASINPTNIVLMLIALFLVVLYDLIKYRKQLRPLLVTIGKIALTAIPLNIWWLLPFLNVYLFSPHALNSTINIGSWSWTQERSSFLNLFWLNGIWSWLPDYVPYLYSYSSPLVISQYTSLAVGAQAPPFQPILAILVFVPFILAATALLFKTDKSKLNVCLMAGILVFLFLAKGIHEPLSDALLYQLPLMNMFREPTTKFTLLMVLFLAPLIGFSTAKLANLTVKKRRRLVKVGVPVFLAAILLIAVYPMLLNPLETKTQDFPYSSYVAIPNYWYDAASWINSQTGDYKVLFSPLDDFYQMPYTWGYYGIDQLLVSLIDKPVVSSDYLYSYVLKPESVTALNQLSQSTINNNQTTFRLLLDSLNIKYILQRNDVNVTNRNMPSPEKMADFFSEQPYLHLIKSFGELDIYEYDAAKPLVYVLPTSEFNQTSITIETLNETAAFWNFNSPQALQEWTNKSNYNSYPSAYGVTEITADNGSLKVNLWNTPLHWEIIGSPTIPVVYGTTYDVQADVKGQGYYQAYLRVFEYASNGSLLSYVATSETTQGKSNWTTPKLQFSPSNIYTKNIQVQIWCSGLIVDSPVKNTLWINNVNVTSHTKQLVTKNLDQLYNVNPNSTVSLIQYQNINPAEMKLTINATDPFVIVTSQSLDSSWIAKYDGQQTTATPLYLGLTGFFINSTGQFEVTISYQPQSWFYVFCIISIITLILCVTYLVGSYLTQLKRFF
ncbi:MAG: alpha-(1-_3)-arabinofuranosyltransferase family protein [Candidatus Bathyarchaeota archaeon]|nr:alpha-(1->3)-arabinofuranosyltransferase family protein [Candidatus Bathyarchaeota archaeon]